MIYEVYRNVKAPRDEYDNVDAIYKRVMSEDKALVLAAHENIERNVFINGELHPRLEQGPVFFQKVCREVVMDHLKEEKKAGHKIWPASYTPDVQTGKDSVVTEKLDNALPTAVVG